MDLDTDCDPEEQINFGCLLRSQIVTSLYVTCDATGYKLAVHICKTKFQISVKP